MKWARYWPETLFSVLIVALEASTWVRDTANAFALARTTGWTAGRKLAIREQVRELWYHGFNSYMKYAFPLDELAPLSCSGRGPDWENHANFARNDVAGNFSLTLVDILDTFVILDDRDGFEHAVRNVINTVSFDVNTKPQVFETTIRVLGGLLSGHIYANKTGQPFYLPWYRGELLHLAHDLGKRLLPAFSTPTGIPYARLNLRHGITSGESIETCTAGAGTLILEFATLSRLTGDNRFEKAAYKAYFALWNRRSEIGLVGNTINTWTGSWSHPEVTGIGAGIDSFYEYAFKWYIMSGEMEFLDVWHESYASVMRYVRSDDGFWYRSVNIHTGDPVYPSVDSLSAFWPGLQVLAGDVQNAVKLHLMYWNLWRRHSGLPEVFDASAKAATSLQYPLRPEFVESTWYLYRATKDEFYLDVGERILRDITIRSKVECGLASIRDLRLNQREDRMESFVLSETLKYLFLLFDEENPIHTDDSNFVLTTEGHILSLDREHLKPISPARRKIRRLENHQCPAYEPFMYPINDVENETGLTQCVLSRGDAEYSRELVGLTASDVDQQHWRPYGWCESPKTDLYSYDFILSSDGQIVPEDFTPSLRKVSPVPNGYIVQNVSGIRAHLVSRLDGKGYDVTKLGPHAVKTGQIVFFNDSSLTLMPLGGKGPVSGDTSDYRQPEVSLRFFTDISEPVPQVENGPVGSFVEKVVTGYTGLFGRDLSNPSSEDGHVHFGSRNGTPVVRDEENIFGCQNYGHNINEEAALVIRGGCTFIEKLSKAKMAGASGVIVISDDDIPINPSAGGEDPKGIDDISDVAIVVLKASEGRVITEMLNSIQTHRTGRVMVTVEPEYRARTANRGRKSDPNSLLDVDRILYLNGHALVNTRLLV